MIRTKFIEELGRRLNERLLDIWEGRSGLTPAQEEAYRNLWRVEAGREPKIEPCRFLGEYTGETIPCGPCGGKVRLKLYECSHNRTTQTITLEMADASVSNCLDCRWKNKEPEPEQSPTTRRHLLCHLLPVPGNGVWQRAVEQLRLRWKLFDGRKIFAVMTGEVVTQNAARRHTLESVEIVRALLPADAEIVPIANDANLREVASWGPLWDRVLIDAAPNDAVLYCHTKGATRPVDPGNSCQWWASMLWSLALDHWGLVEHELKNYPLVGPFKKVGRGFGDHFGEWHFSGTFFWSRVAAMRDRYHVAVPKQWWGVEAWPGLAFRPEEAASIFTQGEIETLNLYSPELWASEIRPRYEQWIKGNPPDWKWQK